MCKGGTAVSSVISSNFGCAFLEYQMFKYRGITLAYLFVPFCISFTFKIFQTLHYFIFPFATRKLHYKRHILNFVILLWSDRYLVSVLISQKTPHAAISLLSTTHLLLYMILRYKNKLLNCHLERCWGDQVVTMVRSAQWALGREWRPLKLHTFLISSSSFISSCRSVVLCIRVVDCGNLRTQHPTAQKHNNAFTRKHTFHSLFFRYKFFILRNEKKRNSNCFPPLQTLIWWSLQYPRQWAVALVIVKPFPKLLMRIVFP